ncbi:1-phosphofructokinase family hexose kinase [Rhodococcus sp. BP-252]|uniref:1-phosphofructokinase n=1 Tax=Rhodococcoides kyotonense TaxID=398843 RepID=A0A177YBM3_9NOCA|nr:MULTISPECIES: 1-phosphofructokinase family hexose kinase [Rhodococcus]MBY6410985.1 1-phosphofructokinase family hexose kinase [Rhodococcus sp. BP-320]MBY6415644.1 1-phosphofructokinase family hexose kinase [Rhodococcus sp. BP-321]MBY6420974.1 1-phosphofructokinase family hexose kinase [Rhodococcus sp. BP-324]MBY6426029.1 1-phosphofructokinase family hexose kinase [Rhodococcus sp. BP-323]MBY6430850.1 1-phosphofructokinase family hexose kinase [Rhodococcus sp. BP-322]
MIVTLTANPSIDRTVVLDSELVRGGVHRARTTVNDPGGKGVNVARVLTGAGVQSMAVLPAASGDPLLEALSTKGVRFWSVPTDGLARTNITVSEPGGTTTKINEPGAVLTAATRDALFETVVDLGRDAAWVALSGSLPPGIAPGWYAELVRALRETPCRVAVDTSDEPLLSLAESFPESAPDLIKPNSEELAQLTGVDGDALEQAASAGDPTAAVEASRILLGRGVGSVLATLGSAGAVLVTAEGAWFASPPRIDAISTVGAGDSSLAGYILADIEHCSPADRLRRAVAFGTAATALPGTTLPTPNQARPDAVTVHALDSPPASSSSTPSSSSTLS